MSQLLYAEAQSLTKQAFREVILEAAKARFRDRFGDKIRGLAELAVDELLGDVTASLEIETHIREHGSDRGRAKERLREIFRRDEGMDRERCKDGGGDERRDRDERRERDDSGGEDRDTDGGGDEDR